MSIKKSNPSSVAVLMSRALLLCAVALAVFSSRSVQAAPATATISPERGVTKPKSEPRLVFYGPGVVMKLLVEEGQTVKTGEILAVQDDREELAKAASIEGDIVSAKLQIEASQADLEQKQLALKRKQLTYPELVARGGSNQEIEEAIVAVKIGDIAVKFRTQELEQKKLELKLQQVKIEQKKLQSPIDGIVSKIDVKLGEGSDISKPAMTIVQNSTLYVEVDVPVTKAKSLRIGDALQVSYPDDRDKMMTGKIIFLTPYASASSGTRKIRLAMANEYGREAGLVVYVKLPDVVAEAK